jgi:hypothetical protein
VPLLGPHEFFFDLALLALEVLDILPRLTLFCS